MECIPIVHGDVWRTDNVGSDEEHMQLLSFIKDLYSTTPEVTKTPSNIGCWRHPIDLSDYPWLKASIDASLEILMNEYSGSFTASKNGYNLSSWINVNAPTSRNVIHNHLGSTFSGVYYLQAEETGAVTFYPPLVIASGLNAFNGTFGYDITPYSQSRSVDPKDKMLIMFPSWLPHEVEVNNSGNERINIAFNITPIIEEERAN